MEKKKFNLILNVIGIIVIGFFVFKLLSFIKHLVFLIIASVLTAYLLKPPVDFLCVYGFNFKKNKSDSKGLSRTISIFVVYAVMLLIIIFLISFAVPKIQSEATKFVSNFPDVKDAFLKNMERMDQWLKPRVPEELYQRINQTIINTIQQTLQEVGTFLTDIVIKSGSIIGAIFSTLATILLVPLLAFLLLKDADIYKEWFLNLFPMDWRKEILSVLSKIDDGLGSFIRGQILVCICIGISTIIAFTIFRLDYAIFLGTLVGILNIVPFAGPILGAVPPLLLAIATKSPLVVFGVFLSFIVIHELEKQIVAPALVGHSVGLPTVVILISVIGGAEVYGFIGVLVAVPFVLTLRVILMHFHQKWSETWPENKFRESSSTELVGQGKTEDLLNYELKVMDNETDLSPVIDITEEISSEPVETGEVKSE